MNKGYILLLSLFLVFIFSFFAFTLLLNLNIEIKKVSSEINDFILQNSFETSLNEVLYRLSEIDNPFFISEMKTVDPSSFFIINERNKSIRSFFQNDDYHPEIKISYKNKDGLIYFYDEKNKLQFIGEPKEFFPHYNPVILVHIKEEMGKKIKEKEYEIVESYEKLPDVLYYGKIYVDSISPFSLCEYDHSEIPFNTSIKFCNLYHKSKYENKETGEFYMDTKDKEWKDVLFIEDTNYSYYRMKEIKNDIRGKGILFIDGDAKMEGYTNIYWKGLLYVNGSLIISPDYSGSIWICGALFVKDNIIYLGKRSGFITILYSKDNLKDFGRKRFLIIGER